MIRLVIWLAGCVALAYAIIHLGFSREAAGAVLSDAFMLWSAGGGVWVARGAHREPRETSIGPAERAALRDALLREKRERRAREGVPR